MKNSGPSPSGLRAPPMVLLHGFTGSAESWGPALLQQLSADGRRVVALDLPGHGSRGGDEEARLTDVVELVSRCVRGPFDLFGYSMGGRLALHCALALPDRIRRLVLESASPGLALDEERAVRRDQDDALAERIQTEGVSTFARAWAGKRVLRPGPRRAAGDHERALRIRRSQRPEGLAAALRGLGTGSLPSLWDRLPELRQPTGLIVGTLDDKFEDIAHRMARSIPESTVAAVPDAGHTVHLDRPDAWVALVERWLGDGP